MFYSAELSLTALLVAGALLVGLFLLNRRGIIIPAPYLLLGIPLWVAVLKSGVHATLAGVVLADSGVLPVFALANAGYGLLRISLSREGDSSTAARGHGTEGVLGVP